MPHPKIDNPLENEKRGRSLKIKLEEGKKLFVFAHSYQRAVYWTTVLGLSPGQFIYVGCSENMLGARGHSYIDLGGFPVEWGPSEFQDKIGFERNNSKIDWRSLC